jgi:hypothetical protein
MIRTALDSDDLSAFSPHVDFILTYSDLVPDAAAFEAEHKGQRVVYLDRGNGDPGDKATIIDVERGTYNPSHVPAWYDYKAARKLPFLTYYCQRSTVAAVQAVIGGRHMYRHIATLDGSLNVPGFTLFESPDLVQAFPAAMLGIHADLSLVFCPTWRPAEPTAELAKALITTQDIARDLANAAAGANILAALIRSVS